MRKVAVTAFAVQVIVLILAVVLRPPSGPRNPVPRRSATDPDADGLRVARRRVASEGRHEPERSRIPYATLTPAPEETSPRRSLRVLTAPAVVDSLRRRLPRGGRTRIALPLGVAFLALLVASTALVPFAEPESIVAKPPSTYAPIPVTGVTTPIAVDREPDSMVVVEFSAPMNSADVEARLSVEPVATLRLRWSADGTRLTIEAEGGWQLGTYYTVTIPAGALDATGAPLAAPVRAAFLIRGLTTARITTPRAIGGLARLDTTIVVSFDRSVDLAAAAGAFTIEPALVGSFTPASGLGRQLVFTPAGPLDPDTVYRVTLAAGLLDSTGAEVEIPKPFEFRTVSPPRIRSTTPQATASGVDPTTSISIRFSRPMDPTTTLAAFSASVAGTAIGGTTVLSDGGALLTFRPAAALPAGSNVDVRIAGTASGVDGVEIGSAVSLTFRVRGSALPVTSTPGSAAAPAKSAAGGGEADGSGPRAETARLAAVEREEAKAAKENAAKAKAAKAKADKAAKAKADKADRAAKAKAAAKAAKEKAAKAAAAKAAKAKAAGDKDDKEKRAEETPAKSKGGTSAGGGSWVAVEAYYLELVNCTRTGGWVSSSGKCSGAGSRKVKRLKLDAGISASVSRPYAKKLATSGACSHFSGGGPSSRLRRAGFSSHRWAENLSCPPGMSPARTAVYSIRYFQNEKPWNGGHYRNLMNPAYDRVGIGIWAANGRVIIVSNFYKP